MDLVQKKIKVTLKAIIQNKALYEHVHLLRIMIVANYL